MVYVPQVNDSLPAACAKKLPSKILRKYAPLIQSWFLSNLKMAQKCCKQPPPHLVYSCIHGKRQEGMFTTLKMFKHKYEI